MQWLVGIIAFLVVIFASHGEAVDQVGSDLEARALEAMEHPGGSLQQAEHARAWSEAYAAYQAGRYLENANTILEPVVALVATNRPAIDAFVASSPEMLKLFAEEADDGSDAWAIFARAVANGNQQNALVALGQVRGQMRRNAEKAAVQRPLIERLQSLSYKYAATYPLPKEAAGEIRAAIEAAKAAEVVSYHFDSLEARLQEDRR